MNTTTAAVEVAGKLYQVTDIDSGVLWLADDAGRDYIGMPTHKMAGEYYLSGLGPYSRIIGTFEIGA